MGAIALCNKSDGRSFASDDIELLVCVDPDVHGPIFELTQLDQELPNVDGPALSARRAAR